MFMLILTIQKYKHMQMVYSSGYTPELSHSEYAFLSPRYTEAYMKMAEELYKKNPTSNPTSFYWGWAKNPYLDFYKYKERGNLVGAFVEVPKRKVVVSDYDGYCAYIEEESDTLDLGNINGECLQAIFNRVSPSNIKSVVNLNTLYWYYQQGVTDIKSLYQFTKGKDIRYSLDTFILPDFELVSVGT